MISHLTWHKFIFQFLVWLLKVTYKIKILLFSLRDCYTYTIRDTLIIKLVWIKWLNAFSRHLKLLVFSLSVFIIIHGISKSRVSLNTHGKRSTKYASSRWLQSKSLYRQTKVKSVEFPCRLEYYRGSIRSRYRHAGAASLVYYITCIKLCRSDMSHFLMASIHPHTHYI